MYLYITFIDCTYLSSFVVFIQFLIVLSPLLLTVVFNSKLLWLKNCLVGPNLFGQMFNTTTFYCSSITPFSDYFKKKPTCLIWKYLIGTPQSLKGSKAHFHWFFTASHRCTLGEFDAKFPQNIRVWCFFESSYLVSQKFHVIWLLYLCSKIHLSWIAKSFWFFLPNLNV